MASRVLIVMAIIISFGGWMLSMAGIRYKNLKFTLFSAAAYGWAGISKCCHLILSAAERATMPDISFGTFVCFQFSVEDLRLFI